MHTQTKKLVGAIGATAAFTAALLLAVGSGLALTKRRWVDA